MLHIHIHNMPTAVMTTTFKDGDDCLIIDGKQIDKYWSHDGKHPHTSLENAQKAAASYSKKRGMNFEGYACRHCDFFHVGRIASCY